ncbi:MAG: TonB-dependent receptor [Campylobacterales bacterium]|nr:TonB-dependent receptor [Campylobacterales bacterium]
MKKTVIALSLGASSLLAQSFTLGEVSIVSKNEALNMLERPISAEDIATHTSLSVNEAFDNISGVSQDLQGGRAESTLYIRGFDARRIGVFIDGIPIYMPYDGNFDYARFLGADIAKIDLAKGYSSVVYGGNTLGGVVNIVSRKPTKAIEGDVKGTLVLDSASKMARHVEQINLGAMTDGFYAQLGAASSKQDHFRLSDDYDPTPSQPKGERLRSENEDKKMSLKLGYMADDQSEIALSYANQQGVKEQPPVTDTAYASNKYWDWPYWDKETFSIVGQKNFDAFYLKTLLYYDTIKNSLYSYGDDTYSTFSPKGFSFKSRYDDHSYGTRLELGAELGAHFVSVALNYKKDEHKGYDISKTSSDETLTEEYSDRTLSLGAEDRWQITHALELLAGLSFDQQSGEKIFDTNKANLDMLDLKTHSSITPQAALIYSVDEHSKLRLSAAQKTHMPSMKERYSRRLGTAVPNVALKNEIADHYEVGYARQDGALQSGVNLFFSHLKDAIQSVPWDQNSSLKQNQNVGTFDHIGAEVELAYSTDTLTIGGNYTHISIDNTKDDEIKIVDVPKHQLFAFVKGDVGGGVSLYANARYRSGAYENKMDGSYVTNPDFATFDAKVIYTPIAALSAEIGVKNLTDAVVRYDRAYPMAGREYFAALGYRF